MIRRSCPRIGVTPRALPGKDRRPAGSGIKKLISWNVNGIRAVEKKGFTDIVAEMDADILAIQETKAHPDQLSQELKAIDGYESYWHSAERKGYSGVAVYSRLKPRQVTYGLGSESGNLPGYVVLTAGRGSSGGATLYQSGFLPSSYAGVLFRNEGDAVLNLSNPQGVTDDLQRKTLSTIKSLNQRRYQEVHDPEITSRIGRASTATRSRLPGTREERRDAPPGSFGSFGHRWTACRPRVGRDLHDVGPRLLRRSSGGSGVPRLAEHFVTDGRVPSRRTRQRLG